VPLPALDCDPSTCASQIPGITDVSHCTKPVNRFLLSSQVFYIPEPSRPNTEYKVLRIIIFVFSKTTFGRYYLYFSGSYCSASFYFINIVSPELKPWFFDYTASRLLLQGSMLCEEARDCGITAWCRV
jgi:hypothetical protein